MANMIFTKKSLNDFIKSNPSLQLQANFEFRWPVVFDKNSFLIDTLEVPEIDSTQGYRYLDGYQIPVLGTPRFTNTIRVSFWAEEPFLKKYFELFNELVKHETLGKEKSEAYIIPVSTEKIHSLEVDEFDKKALCLYDTKLKQITVDEHSSSSQALVHINLTIVFGAFDIVDRKLNNSNSRLENLASNEWDYAEKMYADTLYSVFSGNWDQAQKSYSEAVNATKRANTYENRLQQRYLKNKQ